MPVAMAAGSTPFYLARDQAGSLGLIVNSPENVVKSVQYDFSGNVLSGLTAFPFLCVFR
jgi:hypothetical protein